MWHPGRESRSSTQMEGHVTEDGKKRFEEDDEAGNVDSGFLSSGNLQFSGEIRDSGLLLQQEEQPGREVKKEGATIPASAPVTTTASSSSSSSAAAVAEELMRTTDSGVVLDLTDTLSQLSLKQVSLNPLASKSGKLIQAAESTSPELSPVTANLALSDSDTYKPQHHDEAPLYEQLERETSYEEPWQLYYTQDDDGDTQLHIAIVQGFVEAALCLIRMAPDPCLLDTMNDDWQSPLHLAVLTHQPLIVRHLILAGADPSLRNFRGNTALHLACACGDLACAKALTDPLYPMERNKLTFGQQVPALPQNLEQRNYNGEMCLHVAAANGHADLVRLLLRLGADIKAKEGLAGYTALHLAVERECRPVFELLLPECQRTSCLDERTYRGTTAYQLTLDAHSGFAKEARRKLMRHGATPEPLPESDSESSEDEDTERSLWTADYLPAIVKAQTTVGVTV
ncbi:NF-kappa-B inhibitor cactus-like [Nylanderia fulva]|uniref:NF-kappa-B inhibitor cactus-like n=1 Tax=Nylanderia fulva TaxID=613905 RepID=UPI0010FAFEAC|nr:NF-kappa-B inhibitor cactus-like [Nylanderia fulva]